MRGVICLLVIVALTAGMHSLSLGREDKKFSPISAGRAYTVREMLENAPIILPDYDMVVSLDRGEATFGRGNARGSVALGDVFATARTADGIDFIGYIVVSGGGVGTFRYLVLYSMTKQGLVHSDSAFLGDRVQVRSIHSGEQSGIEEYQVTITILDRKPKEPMSAPPTLERKLNFVVSGRRFFRETD